MINLDSIARKLETPVYVLDLDRVRKNVSKIKDSITYPNFQIHYAMFCNNDKRLLRFLKGLDLGVLVLNEKEIETALKIGFPREQIHLTGGTFTRDKLEKLLTYSIDTNLDSLRQLELLGKIKPGSEIGIRIRLFGSDIVGAGEGVSLQDVKKIDEVARRYKIKIKGLQTYIGTNILDEQKYLDSVCSLISISSQFPNLRYINIGGGFGIPYSSIDKEFRWDLFGREVSRLFEQIENNSNHRIQLKMEPGRSIVGNAGYFLTEVIELRNNDNIVVNAPYTLFIRPFVYHTNHRVRCIGKKGKTNKFKIRGCSINSKDYLSHPEFEGDNADLPKNLGSGDILCFSDVGAYSPVMQMDFLNYNKAPMVLINQE